MDPRQMSEQQKKTIMPGMEEVVEAGDTLVITDTEGKEIAVQGRESQPVMNVLVALDNYVTARLNRVEGMVLDSLWKELLLSFGALPPRVAKELPSYRMAGVVLGHDH